MTGLLDTEPNAYRAKVVAGGLGLEVRGLDVSDFTYLASKFDHLGNQGDGNALGLVTQAVTQALALPQLVSEIIAIGCGLRGNEKAMVIARSLPLGQGAAIVGSIFKLTFPEGFRLFTRADEDDARPGRSLSRGLFELVAKVCRSTGNLSMDPRQLTPRQLKAWADEIDRAESHQALMLASATRVAMHGNNDDWRRMVRLLTREE
jgi:hypothetical protein